MDAFSSLAENLHLYDTRFHCIQGYGQWSYHMITEETLVFYLVIKGGLCLQADGDTRIAHEGDMIMLSHSTYHTCHALKLDSNNNGGNSTSPNKESTANSNIKNTFEKSIANDDIGSNDTKDAPKLGLHTILDNKINNSVSLNEGGGELNVSLVLIECHYDKELTRPFLSTVPVMLPEQVQNALKGSKVLDIGVQFLAVESSTERLGKATMMNRLTGMLMIECLRTYIENLVDATDSWLLALKDPYLAKALVVMHEMPEENWTINKLAEVAGMSRSSFAERFKQVVGVPPLTYLINYRLRSAARYLRLQQHSISRISELVGYASDSTFSQAFKRVYGVSPRKYRQQNQPNQSNNDVLIEDDIITGVSDSG